MKNKSFDNQSGFMALMSAIIISVVLIAITVGLSMNGFFVRSNVLNSEYKNVSSQLAEGCADGALLNLINNPAYNPSNQLYPVGSNNCTIVSVTPSGSQRIIKTQGIYPSSGPEQSYTDLQVTVTPSPGSMTVNAWEELAHF